jgi:hypothetical protein
MDRRAPEVTPTAAGRHVPPRRQGDDVLQVSLRRARRAWWSLALRRSVLVSVLTATLVVPLAWLHAVLTGSSGMLFPERASTLVGAALAVFITVLAGGIVLTALRAPSLLALARRADHRYAQAQRMSTAYEVLGRSDPATTVVRALLIDVDRRARDVDWPAVARTPLPRATGMVATLVVVIGLLAVWVPVPELERSSSVSSAAPTGPAVPRDLERAVLDAAAAGRVAELLAAAPETARSPYVQAVAASFDDLAERLATGMLSEAETEKLLDELFDHLRSAARQAGGGLESLVDAALAPPASGDGSLSAGPTMPQDAGSTPIGLDGEDVDLGDLTDADRTIMGAPSPSPLDRLAASLEAEAAAVAVARAGRPDGIDAADLDDFYGGVARAATDPRSLERSSGMRADEAAGAGDVAGVAQASNERAGDGAGEGRGGIGSGDDSFLFGDDPESIETVALPRNEREEGRRTQLELIPDEVLAAARSSDVTRPDGPFGRSDEADTTTRAIGPAHRQAVSRYFSPVAALAGGAP